MFGEWQYVCRAYGERCGWLRRVRRERAGRRTEDDGILSGGTVGLLLLTKQRRVLVGLCFREQSGSRSGAKEGSPFRGKLVRSRVGDRGPAPAWQRREGQMGSRRYLLLEADQAAKFLLLSL